MKLKQILLEIEVTAPDLSAKIAEYAKLNEEIERKKAELEELEKKFKPLDAEFVKMLDEMDATSDRCLRIQGILISIKKTAYVRTNKKYKEAFDWIYERVNGQMKSLVDEAMKATQTTTRIATSISVQRTSELNEGWLDNLWQKTKQFFNKTITSLRSKGSSVDADIAKMEGLIKQG